MTTATATKTLYILLGTTETVPEVALTKEELGNKPGIVSLELRGVPESFTTIQSEDILAGVAHMGYTRIEEAKKFGVELQLHIEIPKHRGPVAVITEGRLELLAAIEDALNQGPSYAKAILQQDSMSFGDLLDLDLSMDRALRVSAATEV